MKYNWNKENIEQAVKISDSYSETLRNLGIPNSGRNSETLKRKIEEYSLDISHFTFSKQYESFKLHKTPIDNYLQKGTEIQPYKLKMRLLEENLKENKCECCGISEWNGKAINCQLHHIDGDETNNELSNLQMLCPNCHSQTDNFCGAKNKPEQNTCLDCEAPISQRAKYCRKCYLKHL